MKRLFFLLVLFVGIAGVFTFGAVHPVYAACVILSVDGPISSSVPIIPGHSFTYNITGIAPFGPITVPFFTSPLGYDVLAGNHLIVIDNDINCAEAPLPLFSDRRENKFDAIQTVAVYCGVPHDGDVRAYALFNNVGYLAFTVTKAELAAGVQKPATPYLIKSGKGAELWRLPDGSLRIKRGAYVFDWHGC